jgi:hypothetical protein
MPCPAEFILMQYADAELPEEETRELRAHLEVCRGCRELTAALLRENRVLAHGLKGDEGWETERVRARIPLPEGHLRIGRLAGILLTAAILLRAGAGLIMDLEPPAGLDWLFPVSLSGQLNWFANGFFLRHQGGRSHACFAL